MWPGNAVAFLCLAGYFSPFPPKLFQYPAFRSPLLSSVLPVLCSLLGGFDSAPTPPPHHSKAHGFVWLLGELVYLFAIAIATVSLVVVSSFQTPLLF